MKLRILSLLFWFYASLLSAVPSQAASDTNNDRLVTLRATLNVKNTGDVPLNSYIQRLTIPADDHAQQRLLRIEYPYPDSYAIRPHKNGVDSYMQFKWDIQPKSELTREVDFHLRVTPFDHKQKPITQSANKTSSNFLAPSEYVESDSTEIQTIAQRIKAAHTTPMQQLLAAFQHPQKTLRYKQMENRGALFALHSGTGDCTEYAAIFVALSRALGIPARMTSEFNFAESETFALPNHHAAEAYLDEAWIPVDPNLALQPSLGYGFGYGTTTKVILKRSDSWTWSNSIPGTSRAYRARHVSVDIHWSISPLDLPN